MIRLFVTDVDGTLIPEGVSSINPRYFEVIRELKKKGMVFGAASGRQINSLHRVFTPVKEDIIYISCNGAVGYLNNEMLFRESLSKEQSEEIVRDTRSIDGCQSLYDTGDVAYFEKGDYDVYNLMKNKFCFNCEMVDDLTKLDIPCLKFSIFREKDVEELTNRRMNAKWENKIQVCCGGTQFMDYMKLNVNKGTALRKFQERLGISPEETAAFGDNTNDLEMFEYAKYSFAIGNAREEAKTVASYVGDVNVNDGVLQVLEDILTHYDSVDEALEKYRKR